MIDERDAVCLLKKAAEADVDVWIDGGWGVDALVGRQTRPHNDIDIFIQKKDVHVFTNMLAANGFREIPIDYTTSGHTAWRDDCGRVVDLHLFEFGKDGTLIFEDEIYDRAILDGHGKIGEVDVRCLTAEAQLLYHQGYRHDENDLRDVLLLCREFGLPIPAEYAE